VSDLQGPAHGGLDISVGLSLPGRAERRGQVVQRFQPRLEPGPGSLHVPDNQASELQSSVLSLRSFGLAVGHHGCQPDQLVGIHDRRRVGRGGLGVFQRPLPQAGSPKARPSP